MGRAGIPDSLVPGWHPAHTIRLPSAARFRAPFWSALIGS